MDDIDHRIVIVGGCGRVGLPLEIVLAVFGGTNVTLLDIDASKVEVINHGRMPFLEEGAEELLVATTDKDCLAEAGL
jgi:UDP-N-acetyl-D-mannosaminuronic acid dehydrogenase